MEPILGQIQLLPYSYAPTNWALCNGQTLEISKNTALYALLGTKFGGDGHITFALPNMKSTTTDVNYFIALKGTFPAKD